MTKKNFYVPSLEHQPFSFFQLILTIVFIGVIFSLAMTLRPA